MAPFDHKNVYAPAGVTLRSTAPLDRPQVLGVMIVVMLGGAGVLLVTVKLAVELHPSPSETVTV